MSTVSTNKIFIQVDTEAEQQEHLKNQRKTFKVLQGVATDKENLTGRPEIDKLNRLKAASADLNLASTEYSKRKKLDTKVAETQTTPKKDDKITAEELTNLDIKPGVAYWEKLAEKRREALEKTLAENQLLHEQKQCLEEELSTCRQMLEETKNLVEVLKEIIAESEENDEERTSSPVEIDEAGAIEKPDDNNPTANE